MNKAVLVAAVAHLVPRNTTAPRVVVVASTDSSGD